MDWIYVVGDDCYQPEEYSDEEFEMTRHGYMISNYGRVFNPRTGRFLSERKGDREGHLAHRFGDKYYYIHRLVAEKFVPNPEGYPIVRHLDDDPTNNDYRNLAWGTQKDNHNDAVSNGHYRPFTEEDREKSYVKVHVPIVGVKNGVAVYFDSINEAARSLGLQQANVWKVLNGERQHTCGWKFYYQEVDDD